MQSTASSFHARAPINIKLIGLGGCGGNLVSTLKLQNDQVDLVVANTDLQDLAGRTTIPTRILLGPQQTAGKGAGGRPDVGAAATVESEPMLAKALSGADLVVIVAGMGGGTGTGAAPVVARLARQLGALTLAFVTMPFQVEKGQRSRIAEQGLASVSKEADAVVVVSNQKILNFVDPRTTLSVALTYSNTILAAAISGVIDQLSLPSLMQLDFSHVRQTLSQAGQTMLGIGSATGSDAAQRAMQLALKCDLLEGNLQKARRVFASIIGGSNLGLIDVHQAIEQIHRVVANEIDLVIGVATSPLASHRDRVRVTLIASEVASFRQSLSSGQANPKASVTHTISSNDLPPFLKLHRRGCL
ncbi:MAG TPA: cell division protein FtsZ [Chloroflexus aurantiacus]|jgi:cell division protein FtsZ|uniref:Cell division protein FtsZ n=1 Tax=Chloroflexus aurantiacus (strain ATCC 29366 / DSM 635 / J-10-fl) TaxID=324602 RepID=A9WH25_CHLAA|nr:MULTISPECIES: cell division protein FtsZ [Chloroflexus]ABY34120.1 Tubulin/FtsZ GTPase [Chloroflexus aurantiacus J-10-fl]RMG53713.1 MAG: cell division protein FtsZ [Chloroflexota bacterium]GIV93621.1 MAG: cell division protein FtsZ [Chloroflexus sp.]HBW66175.1 cell division protein FtsZ [Chloroflexus aurantiacus]